MKLNILEHNGWSEIERSYISAPSAISIGFVNHFCKLGFVFFHIIDKGNILDGERVEHCVAITELNIIKKKKINEHIILQEVNKYICNYNKKYNADFKKVIFCKELKEKGFSNYEI